MKKHKTKIIIAAVVVIALAVAWLYDGSLTPNTGDISTPALAAAEPTVLQGDDDIEPEQALPDEHDEPDAPLPAETEPSADSEKMPDIDETPPAEESPDIEEAPDAPPPPPPEEPEPQATPEGTPAPVEADTPPAAQIVGEQHPESREPVEPEDVDVGDESFYVTLSVRVDMILHNMHMLNREKHELVPEDGVIFPATRVRAYEGESVFNILQREMRRARIHMASRFTPIYNSAYVEAINNLYEFDVGPLSGWMYSVNGWFPNFGSSRYLLSPDDVIEWHYTVDLGRDLGVYWIGGQRDG